MTPTLLKGYKVVELASVLAGPSVGMFFAELGAEVIKVENSRSNGDVTRSWKLASEDKKHPFSAYYSSVNYGKKSVFLDISQASDYEQLCNMIRESDLVLVNFKQGDAEKLKVDYEHLKQINPKLLYGEITGFGNSKRIAYDIVLQAESGYLSMNGTAEGELCKVPVAFIDILAAHQLKEGLLLALLQQQKEKRAIKVSVSLYDAALAALINQGSNWLMERKVAQPLGTLHPNIAPYGELFECKEQGKVVLAIGSNRQFKSLCQVLHLNDLPMQAAYESNQARVKNREELAKNLAKAIKTWKRETLLEELLAAQVPVGAVRSINEVLEKEEAQQHILEEIKEGHPLKSIRGNMFRFSY
jgi:crotonobetainyl-CoA:carnitine CoA-transferase CaiB-like acyl-CoA transferase